MTTKPEQSLQPLRLLVRCDNRMVFPISRSTYAAIGVSHFDAFCFTYPLTATEFVEYMEFNNWLKLRNDMAHAARYDNDNNNL